MSDEPLPSPARSDPPAVPQTGGASSASGPQPPKSRHRLRRWVLRGVVGLLLLLVLVIIGVQIALGTNLPRAIVLAQIQQQLGLRAEASGLSTGWFGHTTLRDVKLSLPLAKQSTVEVPVMRVQHTWLPLILIGRPVEIKGIEIDNPKVYAWQETDGRWNLSEVAELLARVGGKQQGQEAAQEATPTAPPKLPRVYVKDATLVVTDNTRRTQTIDRVNVKGEPDGMLVWKYDVSIPDHVAINGQVAPGGNWEHEVGGWVRNLGDWAKPWAPTFPDVAIDFRWRGQAGGAVAGRMQLDRFAVGDVTVRGTVALGSENGVISARPEALVINKGAPPAAPAASPTTVALAALRPSPLLFTPSMLVSLPMSPPGSSPTTAPVPAKKKETALTLSATAGRLTFDGQKVVAERLHVVALGGDVEINGQYSPAAAAGELKAVWFGLTVAPGTSQDGTFAATVSRRLDGGPEVRGTLTTHGAFTADAQPGGRSWNGRFQLDGAGPAWDNFKLTLTAPDLKYNAKRLLSFDGLTLAAAVGPDPRTRETVVSLQTLRLPEGERLIGSGSYNTATRAWWLRLDGTGWPVSQLGGEKLTFKADVGGDARAVAVKELTLTVADLDVRAKGYYVFTSPKPVDLDVTLTHREPRPAVNLVQLVRDQQRGEEKNLLRGTLLGELKVVGTLATPNDPLNLDIRGNLTANELFFRDRRLGDIKADVAGKVDQRGEEAVAEIHTNMLKLLGGTWDLRAAYLFDQEATSVDVTVRDLPLAEIAAAAGQETITGTVDGNWNIYTPGLTFNPAELKVHGGINGRDLRESGMLVADAFGATTTLEGGRVTVPVEARLKKEGVGDGVLKLAVATSLTGLNHLDVIDLSLTNWPVDVPAANALVAARADAKRISVELPDAKSKDPEQQKFRVTSDTVALGADLRIANRPSGKIEVVSELKGRAVDVRQVSGDLLGTSIWGQALIDYDHPLLAAGELNVADINPARVATVAPGFNALSGFYGLHARLAPERSPDALEPLRLDAELFASDDAKYADSAEVRGGRFRAYLNLDPRWGLVRAVLADEKQPPIPPVERPGVEPCPATRPSVPDVNTIQLAGGVVKLWARLVRNEDELGQAGATSISTHVRLAYKCLDINQLVHVGDKSAAQMPGFITGQAVLFGSTAVRAPAPRGAVKPVIAAGTANVTTRAATNPAAAVAATRPTTAEAQAPLIERIIYNLSGDGAAELQHADLGNFGPIAFLYNLMHVESGPDGTGRVSYRIDGNQLHITRLYYFNRGVEARGVARVDDLKLIPDSPLRGTIVGSVRPLKNVKLPFFPDIDQIMGVLQSTSTSVELSGTVRNPHPDIILFGDLGREIREMLVGDVQANRAPTGD